MLLAIEVADASVRYDVEVKLPLYARHKLPEVWIVELDNERVSRHRNPSECGYGRTDHLQLHEPVIIEALEARAVDLSALFSW